MLEAMLHPDGSLRTGRVIAGPSAGAWLDALPAEAVVDLLRLCRRSDAAGAALLEPYLDRRAPGWRVDAERDRDPRPGRPAKPGAMTQEEAYQILGLQRGATAEADPHGPPVSDEARPPRPGGKRRAGGARQRGPGQAYEPTSLKLHARCQIGD